MKIQRLKTLELQEILRMQKADGEQDWIGEKRLFILGLATLAKILDMKPSSSLKCYSSYFSDYSTPKSTWANLDWQETRASSHVLLSSVAHKS